MDNRDQELELVKWLWSKGLSDAQIAPRLAELRGRPVTRNVVIGIRSRNGIKRGIKPGQVQAARTRVASDEPRPQRRMRTASPIDKVGPALPPEETPGRKLIGLHQLERDSCRWPFGDPKREGFGFCGAKAVTGLPYCHAHALKAFETPAQRKARVAAEQRAIEQRRAANRFRQREEQLA